jgi:hypothetical protein
MRTKTPPERHNVRVTSPLARAAALATLVVLLAAAGCGGDEKKAKAEPSATPSASLPTGNVTVPSGVTLTKAGETLQFGQPAVVAYQPNPQRSSVLQLSVDGVRQARISDFAGYQLSAETKKSKPYYVAVTAKNVGTGDLSRTGIPLYAVDSTNSLNQQTSFNNTFAKCPSQPLPQGFTAGKSVKTCLVYVMRPGQSLLKVSYRPLQAFPPITWEGTIAPPTALKTPPHDTKNKKNKKNKKKQG